MDVEIDLTLHRNNLYGSGYVVLLEEDKGVEGEMLLQRDKLEIVGTVEDEYYRVRNEDTLDLIAWRKYRDLVEDPSKYWWVIADANDIFNPFDLSEYVNKEILIPNILNILLLIK